MEAKLLALERALLTVQQEITKFKSTNEVPPEKKQKTLGLKRSAAAVLVKKNVKIPIQEEEDDQDTIPESQ